MSPETLAREILERWSAKDAEGVAAMLTDDAILTGPLAPDGRVQGAAAIRAFLAAQNSDRDRFPAAVRADHEAMSRSIARVRRTVVQGESVAIEATLIRDGGAGGQDVAVFVDADSVAGRIKSVTVYFTSPREPGAGSVGAPPGS